MQRDTSAVTLRDMFLLLCTLSVIANERGSTNMADEVLLTEDNHCKPIFVNGELMPTVPEYMPSFHVSLKGIKRHFVCKLSESTTTQNTPTMSKTESTTVHPNTTIQSTAKIFVTDRRAQNKIFVADLQDDLDFTFIPTSTRPLYITYDSVEKKVYWTDKGKQVYRADTDGGNREKVTSTNVNEPRGIAIAETSRILYIAFNGSITTVDIGQGNAFQSSEENFVTTTSDPHCLEVDEEQGFLYWSMEGEILRKPLNGSGSTETVYINGDLTEITGLSIDLSRDPRRLFFCDYYEERTFYKDLNQNLTMAHELTGSMNDPDINGDEERKKLRDITYFNGTLYWTKYDRPTAIAVMKEYDQSSPSFDIKETSEIDTPFQVLIINVDP